MGETTPVDHSRAQAVFSSILELNLAVDQIEAGLPPEPEVPPESPRTEQR
jgi:hypothetical protein